MTETNHTVLALTGPPAAGKSCIVDLLRSLDVPCRDTGELIRDEATARYDDPTEDQVWDVATALRDEHGPAGPTQLATEWLDTVPASQDVVCLSSLRHEAEVSWLRTNVGPTLVVEVDAPRSERIQRYIDMKVDEQGPVATDEIDELKVEMQEREIREAPYPDADLVLNNSDSQSMLNVQTRLEHTINALAGQ